MYNLSINIKSSMDQMPVKNLVPWTIIISGYAEKGLSNKVNQLYDQMAATHLKLDEGGLISILATCAESGLRGLGKNVIASIEMTEYICSVRVSNALVDMYAKCGSLEKALTVFNGIAMKDVVSWNAMIQGLAMHGHGERALELFFRMEKEGFELDKVTFVGVLCACTHAGCVGKGLNYFHAMERDYGKVEHYGCMIDLLGRGGRVKEAYMLVQRIPIEPNAIIWGTLLGACRVHNAVELAEEVLDRLVKLEPSDPGNFSVLFYIYASVGDWEGVADVRLLMKGTRNKKLSRTSLIELDNDRFT